MKLMKLILWGMRLMDAAMILYFLFLFPVRLLGLVIAALIAYRAFKMAIRVSSGFAYKVVDCAHLHRKDDGHIHVGVPPPA